ncbi:MAG TPA: molybdenum cofactor biosynthesis protein MoaE [Desulfobacterales bacterium]|nr:molybdenum cofactor biosynthesis protein MoaE [Desulfobacterales bacterium]
MSISQLIESMKAHPRAHEMGMIASHLGIVRKTSLKGGEVSAIEIEFDQGAIKKIVSEAKGNQGIIEILVETHPGRLSVGDEIMAVVVGGDTRDHVFPTLISVVDRIKQEASRKKELA